MPQADSPPLADARWRKVEELYAAALALPAAERAGFLAHECAGDAALQREVASLLAHDNRNAADTLLDHALTLALQALAEDEPTGRIDMALLNAGDLIGKRYRIVDALDAGGIGEVYLAEDTTLGKQVVVKVLKKASQEHPQQAWLVKKFRDEAAAQAKVNHPNVASVLDKGKLATGEDYLVVEFIAGANLRRLLKERDNHQMEFAETAEVIRQTGRAVTAIHDRKLIHRDLKPENLMIQTDAAPDATHDEWLVKVIDFGIVRVHGQSTVLGQIAGQIAGMLHYMSPEQLTGRDVTPASDVYALGVIHTVAGAI
ncbi:MAG: serine/threonine protein kinase [Acidobacteria bacterium]|nr:serine/threonine protein kinase [Acidobacteriota bacterium]MBI3427347.1 serine/threonine protein kinase [Acidobacteriota bacterium]